MLSPVLIVHKWYNLYFRNVNSKPKKKQFRWELMMRMIKSTQSAGYLDISVLSKSLTKTELKHKPRVTPKRECACDNAGTHKYSLSRMNGCLRVLKWTWVCESLLTSKLGTSGWNGVLTLLAMESHNPAMPIRFRNSHFCSMKHGTEFDQIHSVHTVVFMPQLSDKMLFSPSQNVPPN